jgi:immunity protein 35 of polymorphic toxin system
MTREQAEQIVRQYLNSLAPRIPGLVIMSDKTIEKEYGWIFFYQTKKYLETNNVRDMMIGNCPILVKRSGETVFFPTFLPIQESIRRYEAGEPFLPPRKKKSE